MRQSTCVLSISQELKHALFIYVCQSRIGLNNTVPCGARFLEQKLIKTHTGQLGLCAATPIVVSTSKRHGHGLRFHSDFKILLPRFLVKVDIHGQTEFLTDLARDLFQKLRSTIQPHNGTAIIPAYDDSTALSIGEAADPLEILVPPDALPLNVLPFTY